MKQNFTSTAIVGEIMHETECFFTEDIDELFLFLNTLLVENSTELVESVLCVSTEGRDILRRILPYVDGSL